MDNKEDREGEKTTSLINFSGGPQQKTTEYLQKDGDLNDGQNVRYGKVGGIQPSLGYSQQGSALTSTTSTSSSTSTTTTSTSTSSSTSTTTTSTSSSTTTTSTSTTTTA